MYERYAKSSSKLYIPNTEYSGDDFESVPYMYFDSFFNDHECDLIREEAKNKEKIQAVTFGGLSPNLRNSRVSWLGDDGKISWVYDRIMDSAFKSNVWGFDIFGIKDALQYTRYEGTLEDPAFYGWHKDTGPQTQHRKISFVALLSDPEDYVGGSVQLKTVPSVDNLIKKKGDAIMFPSFIYHQVTKVTEGNRESLVAWISGPKLR